MLIKYQDLLVGDEFFVPSNNTFRFYKVLSLPKKQGSTTFRCSCDKEVRNTNWGKYYVRGPLTLDSSTHNERESVQLGYKEDIWLLKREAN